MDRRIPALALLATITVGVAAWWMRLEPHPVDVERPLLAEPAADAVRGPRPRAVPVGAPLSLPATVTIEPDPEDLPLVGANGQPLPPGTVRPEPGLPERPVPQAPLDDAEAWSRTRTEAALRWREDTLVATRLHAATAGWTPTQTAEAIGILEAMHDALATTRIHIETGRVTPREGRAQLAATRADARARLEGVLGADRTAGLAAALDTVQGGGF